MDPEEVTCPPFCTPECNDQHDSLLLALVNCPDDDITVMYEEKLKQLIAEKQKNTEWTFSCLLDDPNPTYRYPVVLWACALGKPKLLEWLLGQGFESSIQDTETGDSGLHRSIVCIQILNSSTDTASEDEDTDQTSHHDHVHQLPEEAVCQKLQKSWRDLKTAISKFKDLLPLMRDSLLLQDSAGYTPLHTACEMFANQKSSVDFFRKCTLLMLENACSKSQDFANELINCQTKAGETIFHMLAGDEEAYSFLKSILERVKPDLLVKNNQGMTALAIAINTGRVRNAQLLSSVKSPGCPEKTIKNRKTPRKRKLDTGQEESSDDSDKLKRTKLDGNNNRQDNDHVCNDTVEGKKEDGLLSPKRSSRRDSWERECQTSSRPRRSKSVVRTPKQGGRRSRSVGAEKQKEIKGSESCPRLSLYHPRQSSKMLKSRDVSPPALSPKPVLNIFEEARQILTEQHEKRISAQGTKDKALWMRYLEYCESNLSSSMPVILQMTPGQLTDAFTVNPGLREKLADYVVDMLGLDEQREIPEAVREIIFYDPQEEILKDLIAKDVEENEERTKRIKGKNERRKKAVDEDGKMVKTVNEMDKSNKDSVPGEEINDNLDMNSGRDQFDNMCQENINRLEETDASKEKFIENLNRTDNRDNSDNAKSADTSNEIDAICADRRDINESTKAIPEMVAMEFPSPLHLSPVSDKDIGFEHEMERNQLNFPDVYTGIQILNGDGKAELFDICDVKLEMDISDKDVTLSVDDICDMETENGHETADKLEERISVADKDTSEISCSEAEIEKLPLVVGAPLTDSGRGVETIPSPGTSKSVSCHLSDRSVDETDKESQISDRLNSSSDGEIVSSTSAGMGTNGKCAKSKMSTKGNDSIGNPLAHYLNRSSIKHVVQNSLMRDREEYYRQLRKSCDILAEVEAEKDSVASAREEQDAEIANLNERLMELQTLRAQTGNRLTELEDQHESEKYQIEKIKNDLLMVETALEQLEK